MVHPVFGRRRRRGRWLALIAVVLVVVAVAVAGAGVVWIGPMVAYDSIEEGSFSSVGPDGRSVPAGPFGSYVSIRYRAGMRTGVATSLENRGDRDVRVTALGDRRGLSSVRPAGVRIAEGNGTGAPKRYVEFRAFDLPAGKTRGVRLLYRTGGCSALDEGSSVSFEAFNVRYRTGFVEREKTIELRSPIEFRRGEVCGRARSG